ncbi:MAG: glycosyltransferase family 87 protein [Terriglobales bacterium]
MVVFCLISIAVSGRQMLWYFSHGPAVTDLRIFMTGIDMVASGQGRQLYHFDAQQKAQIQLYPETRTSGLLPFNHLAYELLFYWPISKLPYRTALLVWALANVAILFLIARLLAPYSRALTEATGTPLTLYLLAFYPVMYVFGEGQDSLMFMLLVVLSLRSMDAGRTFLAGFLLALACFKFHLALLIAFFVLLLRAKWRGLAGFATGAAVVGGISLALVGPAILHDYPAMLRQQDVMTPWGFIPWFMPNLRGLLQWALAPRLDAGTILPVVFMISAIVGVVATWQTLRNRNSNSVGHAKNSNINIDININDESMAYTVAILTTILISYHLHMQDLTMALLPMIVLADRAVRMWHERRTTEKPNLWMAVLALTIATLYLYRIAAEPFPSLLMRGCLLAVPVFVLWVVALRWWSTPTPS